MYNNIYKLYTSPYQKGVKKWKTWSTLSAQLRFSVVTRLNFLYSQKWIKIISVGEKRRKVVLVLHMLEAADILHACFENLKDSQCNRPRHWENMASIASSTLGLPLGRPHLFASLLNKSFSAFSSVTSSGFTFYNNGLNAKTWMSSYHLIQQNMNDDDFRITLEYEFWIKWITIRYYKQYLGTTRITIWLNDSENPYKLSM